MKSRRLLKAGLFLFLAMGLMYPTVSRCQTLVGVLFSGNIPYYRSMHKIFLARVKNELPIEADVKFVNQFPAPDPVALSNSAKKLVVAGVDLIISYGFPATHAVITKESDIPIIYVGVYDPQALIVKIGSLTGCGYKVPLSSLVRYYKQTLEMERLVVVYSPNQRDSEVQMRELTTLSKEQNINMVKLGLASRADLKKLKVLQKGDAVFLTGSTIAQVMIKDIMADLRAKNIPAVDILPDSLQEGALIALFQDPKEMGTIAADIAVKVISGKNAEEVEPVNETTTEMVFNLAEAKRLGINPPSLVIAEATRVIK